MFHETHFAVNIADVDDTTNNVGCEDVANFIGNITDVGDPENCAAFIHVGIIAKRFPIQE